jgi:hypothetical protein
MVHPKPMPGRRDGIAGIQPAQGNFGDVQMMRELDRKVARPWLAYLVLWSTTMVFGHAARGQDSEMINVNIATKMVQNSVVDATRLFIFEITYSPKSRDAPEQCTVISITVNNAVCRAGQSLGEGRGFWIKPEFASPDYVGRENMQCVTVAKGGGAQELTVNINDIADGSQITHRVVVRNGRPIDYKGSLIRSPGITAEYRPIRTKNRSTPGWQDTELGCARMAIPVIVEPRQ